MIETDAIVASLMEQLQTCLECADSLAENFGESIAAKHYERADVLTDALLDLGVDERLIFADYSTAQ